MLLLLMFLEYFVSDAEKSVGGYGNVLWVKIVFFIF